MRPLLRGSEGRIRLARFTRRVVIDAGNSFRKDTIGREAAHTCGRVDRRPGVLHTDWT
jgi:hypothetical protein